MAAHNWRSLRQRGFTHGISELMDLRTMHAVLDLMEEFGAESAVSGAKKEAEARAALTRFYDKLYKPDMSDIARAINGVDDELAKPPPGFEDDDVEASFDAFMAAASG